MISPMKYLMSSVIAAENDPLVMNTVFSLVKPEDIGKELGALWLMMRNAWERHKLIEPVALHSEIQASYNTPEHREKLWTQLNEIWGMVIAPDYWQHYLKLSLSDIKITKLKELGANVMSKELSKEQIDSVLVSAKQTIDDIMMQFQMRQRRTLKDASNTYLQTIDGLASGQISSLKTGLYYEKHICGFRPGDYVILAGRPKMGKSAFANTIICELLKEGKSIMYVNLEMDEQSVINRLVSYLYPTFTNSMLQNPERMTEQQINHLIGCMESFQKLPLYIYCFDLKTPGAIVSELLTLRESGTNIDMIVIDYIGLLRPDQAYKSKYEEASSVSWAVKMIPADFQIPVLALAQLNRKCEERTNKRPIPSDLRDSGTLEQDATALMFIYRDEVYNEKTNDPGIAEVNVAVNRNGSVGTDRYFVDFDHMQLANLTYNTGENHD